MAGKASNLELPSSEREGKWNYGKRKASDIEEQVLLFFNKKKSRIKQSKVSIMPI